MPPNPLSFPKVGGRDARASLGRHDRGVIPQSIICLFALDRMESLKLNPPVQRR